jgi:hypothetical protein
MAAAGVAPYCDLQGNLLSSHNYERERCPYARQVACHASPFHPGIIFSKETQNIFSEVVGVHHYTIWKFIDHLESERILSMIVNMNFAVRISRPDLDATSSRVTVHIRCGEYERKNAMGPIIYGR